MIHITPSVQVKNDKIITWQSPSNIAIVKYWGKKGIQEPINPSISFSLQKSYTETTVRFNKKTNAEESDFQFTFEGRSTPNFNEKLELFFAHVFKLLPNLKEYQFLIESTNSFPHSTGIASSASAMSALSLCLYDIYNIICNNKLQLTKTSQLARLGSGSASRSVYEGWSLWGKHIEINHSTDLHAIPLNDSIHSIFQSINDSILIVNSAQKEISSTKGHALINNHPYKNARIEQANKNISRLLYILKNGDFNSFIEIAEEEALSLHAMMLSSDPGYFLINQNTINIINKIRHYREQTQTSICFTLDAGPNIHLLYPESVKSTVQQFINNDLIQYCENGQVINDHVGSGPIKIN